MAKRTISFILALLTVFALLSPVYAAEETGGFIPSADETYAAEAAEEIPAESEVPPAAEAEEAPAESEVPPAAEEISVESEVPPVPVEVPVESEVPPAVAEVPAESEMPPVPAEVPAESEVPPVPAEVPAESEVPAEPEATAEPEVPAELETFHETYINPLYADIVKAEDLVVPADEPAVVDLAPTKTISSVAEAGAYVRQQMVQRREMVVFTFTTSAMSNDVFKQIFSAALAHTGVPTEGDYLQWQYDWWDAGGSGYGGSYTLRFYFSYYTTAAQETWMDAAVSSVLNSLAINGKSDYEKIRAIYKYICDHVTYDYAHLNNSSYTLQFTAYAALHNGTAVCQGYANLLYRMALTAGVDSRIITSVPHAWNIVRLGGKYYNVDSTWDAGYPESGWQYFLLCDKTFTDDESHIREYPWYTASFYAQYPMGTTDYVPGSEPSGQLEAPTVKIAIASNGIKVSWNKVEGAPRYMVYYKENNGSWKRIGTTTATSYTRKTANLKNGVTYRFTVRCCENDKKTMLSGYVASNSLDYLTAPTVKITRASNGIKVSWNKITGAVRYMVYYRENGGSWKRIGTTTATSYTRKAANLKNGVTYQFTVRCVTNDKKTFLSPYTASNSLKYRK